VIADIAGWLMYAAMLTLILMASVALFRHLTSRDE